MKRMRKKNEGCNNAKEEEKDTEPGQTWILPRNQRELFCFFDSMPAPFPSLSRRGVPVRCHIFPTTDVFSSSGVRFMKDPSMTAGVLELTVSRGGVRVSGSRVAVRVSGFEEDLNCDSDTF